MKILILQLARLGDILQTWPVLSALNRQGHEVHIMVRPRFQSALEGAPVHTAHLFETPKILEPLLTKGGISESLKILDNALENLSQHNFDRIVNLSFSPVSSWITRELSLRSSQEIGRAHV